MSETLQILSNTFNTTFSSINQAVSLTDVLYSDNYNARYVPPLSEQVWKNLSLIYDFSSFYQSRLGVQTVTQPQLQEIFDHFDQIISRQSNLKWLSYSGHDSNIAPLLQALNFTSIDCIVNTFYNQTEKYLNCAHGPIFASHILIEVHENDETPNTQQAGNLYVKVRYNGQYMNICETNSTVCSYIEYEQRIKSAFWQNYTDLCGTTVQSQQQRTSLNESPEINQSQSFVSYYEEQDFSPFSIVIFSIIIGQFAVILYLGTRNQKLKQNQKNQNLSLTNFELIKN